MSNAGFRRPALDLHELGRTKRFADYNGSGLGSGDPNGAVDYQGQSPQQQQQWAYQQGQQSGQQSGYERGQAAMQASGQAPTQTELGATGATINNPAVNPNAYQYGGHAGGAASTVQGYQNLAAAQAQQRGAQIQNQYDPRDQAQVQGTLGQLGNFYTGQLNGTGPSLAAQQAKASMDQSIQAQAAMANSARGGLSGAAAQMQAAQSGAAAQQAAAQQAVQGRIQEEYNAAQGLQGVGQLGLGEQNINAQTAYQQAALQQQQQDINARAGLGYAGLENSVNTEQLNAQMAQQAQMSGNYLGASGMGMNQSQFNTNQSNNMAMGALGAGAGMLMAFGDADFQEPSGADSRPAHLTLREERTVDGNPFLAIADRNTGVVRKVATAPLTHAEARRVAQPHGAGPIFANGAARDHTTVHDLAMAPNRAPTMPMGGPGGMQPNRPSPGPGTAPVGAPPPGAMIPVGRMPMQGVPQPSMARPGVTPLSPSYGMAPPRMGAPGMQVADMDLGARRRIYAHDYTMGDPGIQSQLGSLDYGQMNAPAGAGGGGSFLDQMRAQEAARIQAGTPQGGYTFAQQAYYPGAGGLGTQPQGISSDQAAQAFGGNGPSAGAIAGRAIATGGYDQGWDKPRTSALANAAATKDGANKLQAAGSDLLKASIARIGNTQTPIYQPPQSYAPQFTPMAVPAAPSFSDMDMNAARSTLGPRGQAYSAANMMSGMDGLRGHMENLRAADADLKSGKKPKLGSGKRFGELTSHIEHEGYDKEKADAIAASIGRKKFGEKKMSHLAAAHRGK